MQISLRNPGWGQLRHWERGLGHYHGLVPLHDIAGNGVLREKTFVGECPMHHSAAFTHASQHSYLNFAADGYQIRIPLDAISASSQSTGLITCDLEAYSLLIAQSDLSSHNVSSIV